MQKNWFNVCKGHQTRMPIRAIRVWFDKKNNLFFNALKSIKLKLIRQEKFVPLETYFIISINDELKFLKWYGLEV